MKKKPAQQAEIPNEMSFGSLGDEIREALAARFLTAPGACPAYYIRELYPDRAIVAGGDGELYQIPFTIAAGDVTLGDPTPVEIQYVPEPTGDEPGAAASQASSSVCGVVAWALSSRRMRSRLSPSTRSVVSLAVTKRPPVPPAPSGRGLKL